VVAPEIVKQYVETGKVKLVWHDFAWIGAESRQAAQAARCAGRQGKFWEYHDHLFNNQRGENVGQFSTENLRRFAGDVGLEGGAFSACLERAEDLPAIQQDLATARAEGITATPSFKVNGQRLVGARTVDAFVQAIDAELAKLGR
jgi:protein-disulfide isomerase